MGCRGVWSTPWTCERCHTVEHGPDSWCGEDLPQGWAVSEVHTLDGTPVSSTAEAVLCGGCLPLLVPALKAAQAAFLVVWGDPNGD